jgi:hypothetical protein
MSSKDASKRWPGQQLPPMFARLSHIFFITYWQNNLKKAWSNGCIKGHKNGDVKADLWSSTLIEGHQVHPSEVAPAITGSSWEHT